MPWKLETCCNILPWRFQHVATENQGQLFRLWDCRWRPGAARCGFFHHPGRFFQRIFQRFFGSSCHFGGSCPLSTSFGARFGIGFAVHQRSQIHGWENYVPLKRKSARCHHIFSVTFTVDWLNWLLPVVKWLRWNMLMYEKLNGSVWVWNTAILCKACVANSWERIFVQSWCDRGREKGVIKTSMVYTQWQVSSIMF